MKNYSFLSGFFIVLFSIAVLGALSSCSKINSLKTNLNNDGSQTNIIDPLSLHQSFQPNFEKNECPTIANDTSYRLGAEDEIIITIYNEENLSGKFTIPNIGTINMPLIGETALLGCTIKQAEQLLFDKYTEGYLVNPSIVISVSKYRPFYIIGEVRQPGQYDYIVNMNGLQAVALAGGFTYRANTKTAKILKGKENNEPLYEDINIENKVQPGDVILIKERFF